MQYKVPQNIDLEDKIIGPFTMKQFIYLLIPGGIIYGLWTELSKSYEDFMLEFMIVAVPLGLLGLAFALVKINDRPFEVFAQALIRFLFAPKKRQWVGGYVPENVIMLDKVEIKEQKAVRDEGDLDDLSKALERHAVEMQVKTAIVSPPKTGEPSSTQSINLSVKDVQGAQQKQNEAQQVQKPKGKRGLFHLG